MQIRKKLFTYKIRSNKLTHEIKINGTKNKKNGERLTLKLKNNQLTHSIGIIS